MGIFDIFKSKVGKAADKAGDAAGDVIDRAGDMAGDLKDKAEGMMGRKDGAEAAAGTESDTANDVEARAEDMVSEGAPVPESDGSGGMMGTIKDNAASGLDKAGDMADDASGGKFGDQIDTGVEKAKGMPGQG